MKKLGRAIFLAVLVLILAIVILTACNNKGHGQTNDNTQDKKPVVIFIVDGVEYSRVETKGNEIIVMPTNPKKDGYTFVGWFWDKDTWQRPFTANSMLNEPMNSDMKVYAYFEKQQQDLDLRGVEIKTNTLTVDGANISGKVIYDFGDSKDVKGYFYSFEYDGKLLVQFSKNNAGNCIEYSYDLEKKTGEVNDTECAGVAKPILYLYPEKETDVTVKFSNPEILETTYPKFNGKWEVKAKSNGDLYDKSGKYYYALYWDEKKVHSVDFSEGFYVDKDDAIDFLEKKLSYIGLNDKERNEFIMYWLPVMEKNGKNLVYFELTDERESYNKLLISPKPDSMLRLVIHIKKVDKKVNIPKQSLSKFRRVGFTAVEWGGTTY